MHSTSSVLALSSFFLSIIAAPPAASTGVWLPGQDLDGPIDLVSPGNSEEPETRNRAHRPADSEALEVEKRQEAAAEGISIPEADLQAAIDNIQGVEEQLQGLLDGGAPEAAPETGDEGPAPDAGEVGPEAEPPVEDEPAGEDPAGETADEPVTPPSPADGPPDGPPDGAPEEAPEGAPEGAPDTPVDGTDAEAEGAPDAGVEGVPDVAPEEEAPEEEAPEAGAEGDPEAEAGEDTTVPAAEEADSPEEEDPEQTEATPEVSPIPDEQLNENAGAADQPVPIGGAFREESVEEEDLDETMGEDFDDDIDESSTEWLDDSMSTVFSTGTKRVDKTRVAQQAHTEFMFEGPSTLETEFREPTESAAVGDVSDIEVEGFLPEDDNLVAEGFPDEPEADAPSSVVGAWDAAAPLDGEEPPNVTDDPILEGAEGQEDEIDIPIENEGEVDVNAGDPQ